MALADIPFRVRIGVTGHRVLPEPGRVAASIGQVLDGGIWELFDRTVPPQHRVTPLAYTVLTPLAEGADRLAAKEILKTPSAEVEVVLPLAKEDYLRDFTEAESKAEFEELCRRSRHVSVLKFPAPSSTGFDEPEERRKRAYEQVGRYVVNHCDVLVAIWDGKPSRGRGGTAEIVAFAREKKRPLVIVSSEDPDKVVIEKGSGLNGQAYDRIGMFSRFPVTEAELQTYADKVYAGLFSTPEGEKIPEPVKTGIRQGLIPWYVRASLIAKQSQKAYFRAGSVVYALSPLAVAAVALGILVPAWTLAAFLFELIILLTIYFVIRLADRRTVHKKWIEARLLAERVRSAFFLLSCGVNPAAASLSPSEMSALSTEQWAERAFDEIVARAGEMPAGDHSDLTVCVSFVRARWIGAQIEFQAAKAAKAGRLSRLLEKAGRATFLAAIGAAVWHLVSFLFGRRGFLSVLERPAVFLALVLPALGAAIGGARTHREYSRLAKRGQKMEAALRELDGRFADAADFGDLEALLQETEQLMLQETQDWLMLMKFAKVEAI